MKIPKEIINWSIFVSALMIFNAILLLKTSSDFLFIIIIILGAMLAAKFGKLFEKKYLLLDILKRFKTLKPFNGWQLKIR